MKKIALTALLAAVGMASAQQDPCLGRGGAPLPSYCSAQNNTFGGGAAPVYQTPTYSPPRFQAPMEQPRYVPAPPQHWERPRYNSRPVQSQPYTYSLDRSQWDDWDGEYVDVYVDNTLVLQNVYRNDVGRLRLYRPGRHLIQVVPVGYSYDRPVYTRYYEAPQSGANLTFTFGGNFNIILR